MPLTTGQVAQWTRQYVREVSSEPIVLPQVVAPLTHRSDIQGLRAVAVIIAVLAHAGVGARYV
jgi:hypothetical protein